MFRSLAWRTSGLQTGRFITMWLGDKTAIGPDALGPQTKGPELA